MIFQVSLTIDGLDQKQIYVLDWTSQSPDLSESDNLLENLKLVCIRSPSNLTDVEMFSGEQ